MSFAIRWDLAIKPDQTKAGTDRVSLLYRQIGIGLKGQHPRKTNLKQQRKQTKPHGQNILSPVHRLAKSIEWTWGIFAAHAQIFTSESRRVKDYRDFAEMPAITT